MLRLWQIVVTFTILFMLNLWLQDRANGSFIKIFSPAKNWSEVPIYGLSLGTLAAVIAFAIMLDLIPRGPGQKWADRVPALWLDVTDSPKWKRRWKIFILAVTVAFPLAAQVHFWRRFDAWQAWVDDVAITPTEISLYKAVSPGLVFDWDAHRYGDVSKLGEPGWEGISYLPLWQPILMAMFSAVSLILAIRILRRVFTR